MVWQKKDGALKCVSVGKCGVWGVNKCDEIWYRKCTYGLPSCSLDEEWTNIGGKLKQLSCGDDIVWGVSACNDIWVRTEICEENPTGTGWNQIGGKLKYISVWSSTNEV